jgi:hypothetical protein
VLLARVSKTWAAEAARHLQLDGASIDIDVTSSADSSMQQQRDKQAQHLQHLAGWLQQRGHLVNKLHITARSPQGQQRGVEFQPGAAQAVPEVLAALTAAWAGSGGLRLQQLQLPALPGTPISILRGVLPRCQQLRELRLCNSYSKPTTTTTDWQDVVRLGAALQHLTQLTLLRLEAGLFRYGGRLEQYDINGLVELLPSSLEVFVMDCTTSGAVLPVRLCTSSLRHLVNLRQLTLPDYTCLAGGGGSSGSGSSSGSRAYDGSSVTCKGGQQGLTSDPLSGLTALTYLSWYECMRYGSNPLLLALPKLVELDVGLIAPGGLEMLSSLAPLRGLVMSLDVRHHQESCRALKTLTRLTHLCMFVELEPTAASMFRAEDEARLHNAAAGWGRALSALTGLRSLQAEPLVLQEVDLRPLTALTCWQVDCRWSPCWLTPERLSALLGSLAPARGRLLQVSMFGVPAALHEGCRAAAAPVLGNVRVTCTQD